MQQIKMIGLDLDGTLLNTKKELTENTRRVLREAINAGILVLMATAAIYWHSRGTEKFSGNSLCSHLQRSQSP